MSLIKKFKEIGKNDATIAGGKGASLGEMTQAGIPVPPGFVVLSTTFDKFLQETDLTVEIDAILHKVNHQEIHTVENASEEIQALILRADMPVDIAKEIERYFAELDTKYVAVRSSATAEDSSTAAWAGQLDSFLNTTEKDLLEKVKRCWASLFTPRAIFYRFEKELHETQISVAVVVQKMVNSELSGIAFSVHPVTEDYNQLIIEAGFGLGEAIVSGSITPDSYVVEKDPRRIIDINVNTQERGLYRLLQGGNEWQSIAEPQASSQVLTEKQILELSEIILNIEKHYGFPCDIEWAYEAGKFYVVQSRPITTLQPQKQSTAKENETNLFIKTSVRDFSLGFIEIRYKAVVKLLNLIGVDIYANQIFYCAVNNNGVVTSYMDPNILGQALGCIMSKASNDEHFLENIYQDFEKLSLSFNEFLNKKNLESEEELLNFIELFIDIGAFSALFVLLPHIDSLPKYIQDQGLKYRSESDKISDYGDLLIKDTIKSWLPEILKYEKFILVEELEKKNSPTLVELQKRKKGYIYTNQLVIDITKNDFALKNNITFELDQIIMETGELKGEVAYKGKVVGKVKVVLLKEKLDDVQEGDILVSSMTTPLFIPAMKKAAAFITDEGGITCHAAIIARELKKPCIIGTKIATQILKDGDLVEVDANTGVVKILKN